jgi:hypothetical protein
MLRLDVTSPCRPGYSQPANEGVESAMAWGVDTPNTIANVAPTQTTDGERGPNLGLGKPLPRRTHAVRDSAR